MDRHLDPPVTSGGKEGVLIPDVLTPCSCLRRWRERLKDLNPCRKWSWRGGLVTKGHHSTGSKTKLPAIAHIQKKRHQNHIEMKQEGADLTDRLYVLAALRDTWQAVSLSSSKSIALIADGGDVAGQSIAMCYALAPGIARRFLLPHQVPVHHPLPCVFVFNLLCRLWCFWY